MRGLGLIANENFANDIDGGIRRLVFVFDLRLNAEDELSAR